jgi:hypothetical protein
LGESRREGDGQGLARSSQRITDRGSDKCRWTAYSVLRVQSLGQVSLGWAVKVKKEEVVPMGVCLFTSKQLTIAGNCRHQVK